ncbi:plasmid partitioning protein RepB C-terminal domain-containing protein [Reyranella massiliensis]|uniref:plasmid partitioning protein RepB C-terminal domain-containing protein n=1 Tax=Reyranella massiliensis TaxID=445220 RepID=UPI0005C297D7|nr:plasmid partitioning protein RepB C-terminal domain-containing protein [Reyranella massiliensis]
MSETAREIRMIAVSSITVLNPRSRNKKIFQELVNSIATLGLKKPITVSQAGADSYNLVCGQGRLEAFVALGQEQIPAIVIEASRDDCFVMSLSENMARRQHTPIELMQEVGALKKRGYSIAQIAKKTGFGQEYAYAICYLLDHGEDRLLAGIDRGVLPPTIAMEISRAKDGEVQEALADAYERGTLPGNQVLAIRKIIEQRNVTGKGIHSKTVPQKQTKRVTADALVRAYRRETQRQTLLVKKATLAQRRLLFIATALKNLLVEKQFVSLLQAESLDTLPKPLSQRFAATGG